MGSESLEFRLVVSPGEYSVLVGDDFIRVCDHERVSLDLNVGAPPLAAQLSSNVYKPLQYKCVW